MLPLSLQACDWGRLHVFRTGFAAGFRPCTRYTLRAVRLWKPSPSRPGMLVGLTSAITSAGCLSPCPAPDSMGGGKCFLRARIEYFRPCLGPRFLVFVKAGDLLVVPGRPQHSASSQHRPSPPPQHPIFRFCMGTDNLVDTGAGLN